MSEKRITEEDEEDEEEEGETPSLTRTSFQAQGYRKAIMGAWKRFPVEREDEIGAAATGVAIPMETIHQTTASNLLSALLCIHTHTVRVSSAVHSYIDGYIRTSLTFI